MAETAIAAIAAYAWEEGAVEVAIFLASNATAISAAITVASIYYQVDQARRARDAAKSSYNSSLKDRYSMVRSALEPRTLVLGRQRVSGPIAFVGSYGPKRENLVFVVPLAGHEIDGVEAIYFGDEQITLDAAGNVTGIKRRDVGTISGASASISLSSKPVASTVQAVATYGSTTVSLSVNINTTDSVSYTATVSGGTVGQTGSVLITYQPDPSPFTGTHKITDSVTITVANGSGSASVPADRTIVGAPYMASSTATGNVTFSGTTISVSGAAIVNADGAVASNANGQFQISYDYLTTPTLCNVKVYTGAPGQTADADMIAALPGVWTSAHKGAGIAYLRIKCTYDTTAFPSGLPSVSAVVRGAKVVDPRSGQTQWTDNPALLMRHAARSPLCGNLPSDALINDAKIITAANVCDTVVSYTVQGQSYSRPKYRASTVIRSGTRGTDAMDQLAAAMSGKWTFVDGQLSVLAGAYVTPSLSIDETWLSTAGNISIVPSPHRTEVVNAITGTFADETQDFKELPYPPVKATTYISQDGRELPTDMPLQAVTFSGQAQQCAAAWIRDARQGLRVTLTCNERANQLEWGDSVSVTIARFGWVAKAFMVLAITPTLADGHLVALKEVDPTIWALGTSFPAQDPAPNTALRAPFDVPPMPSMSLSSGTSILLRAADGGIISRIAVVWDAITDTSILDPGAGVEISFGPAGDPVSMWQSIKVPGSATNAYLSPVQDGVVYGIRGRLSNALVPGAWSQVVTHRVIGKTEPPPDVLSLSVVEQPSSGRGYYWEYPSTVMDLAGFSVRYSGGATQRPWDSMVPLLEAAQQERSRLTTQPVDGEYWFAIKASDTSGNDSVNPRYVQALLDASGFGTVYMSADCAALGWPGTKTNCGIEGSTLVDVGSGTWNTTPTTWNSWPTWVVGGGTSIAYEHPPVDMLAVVSVRVRAYSVAGGLAQQFMSTSNDGSSYSAFTAIPSGYVTARYFKIKWVVTSSAAVIYRANVNFYG